MYARGERGSRTCNVSYGYAQVRQQRQTGDGPGYLESVREQREGIFRKERVGPSLTRRAVGVCVNCN